MRAHLLLLAASLTIPPGWCDSDALAWLGRMNQAVDTLNYRGTFIYRHGEKVDTMQIVHGYDERGQRERLISLTGEAREIIRDRDLLTCIWPGSKSVVIEPRARRHGLPVTVPEAREQGLANYRYQVGETYRVAGLPCRQVTVMPADAFRYGYRLCIGEDNAMLLRSEIIDHEGEVVEEMMFTSIEFMSQVPEEAFKAKYHGRGYTTHRAEPQDSGEPLAPDTGWRLKTLPPGFVISSNVKRRMAANPQPVQHMVLTDGLASVSVFIAAAGLPEERYSGITGTGALHAYARYTEGHQVTVVGDVPARTVSFIGEALHYERGVR